MSSAGEKAAIKVKRSATCSHRRMASNIFSIGGLCAPRRRRPIDWLIAAESSRSDTDMMNR